MGTTWVGTHHTIDSLERSKKTETSNWPRRAGQAALLAAQVASSSETSTSTSSNTASSSSSSSSSSVIPTSEGERDIELHPDRVAAVVGRAKAAEALALLQNGAGPGGEVEASLDSPERTQVRVCVSGLWCCVEG